MRRLLLVFTTIVASVVWCPGARAERHVYEPISDQDDGVLLDSTTWDAKLEHLVESDLYLSVGTDGGGQVSETAIAYRLLGLPEGEIVEEARLRVNQQGGEFTSTHTIRISAALTLDPLATPASQRFTLPRTASIDWKITAPWDSSGQRMAKWSESPNLKPILTELLAQPGWGASAKEIVLFLEVAQPSPGNFIRFDDVHPAWIFSGNEGIHPARLIVSETYHDAFWGKELLCRPTPNSIELNVIPHRVTLMFAEYGTDSTSLTQQTPLAVCDPTQPAQLLLDGLQPDTHYYYRIAFRPLSQTQYTYGDIHRFVSLPEPGTPARVCVTSDIHVTNMESLGLWTTLDLLKESLHYIGSHQPDGYHVWVDLGDLVVMRAQRIAADYEETEQRYRLSREYIDELGHSIPFVLVRGNHEEVNGWDDDSSGQNSMAWSGQALLKWFPPPLPNAFYSGNTTPHPDLGLPGDYFAFDVGDLRIRALDPYLFSLTRPHNGHGETGGSLDAWDWTLGLAQYQWLHDDLAAHPSPYSFVGMHHMTTSYSIPGTYYGRGGIEVVDWAVAGRPTFEWGGQDASGQTIFGQKRPGFDYGPVHTLLRSFGNQVVLRGHDHFYARQTLDNMVFVTVAKPDDDGSHTGNLWGWAGNTYYPPDVTTFSENSGFLSITVDAQGATYEYVKTFPTGIRGTVADSFTILPNDPTAAPVVTDEGVAKTWIESVYPNPARVPPRIEFVLGRDESDVTLSVYDLQGRRVSELFRGALPEGRHQSLWDATDGSGRRVASGVYFARLQTGPRIDSVKLIVLD
ncbi:MAG: metallophosphoesterase [bacterium]